MNFFAVFLASKRYVAIKGEWIKNAVVGTTSKVFYSPNLDAIADFGMDPKHYLNTSVDACYEGFVYKKFGRLLQNGLSQAKNLYLNENLLIR